MAIFLLDTDTLTLFQHKHPLVQQRVWVRAADTVVLSVWTVEEQATGWLASCRTSRTPTDYLQAYRFLPRLVDSWASFPLLPLTPGAIAAFDRLVRLRLNVGRYDLRIAATALDVRATVVTRNRRDFGRVPGLAIEDWSA